MQEFVIAAMAFYTSVVAIAQPSVSANGCGTILTHEVASRATAMVQSGKWDEAREFLRSGGGVQLAWVPMSIHIVRYDDGSDGLPQSRIDTAIEDLNDHVADTGLRFFQSGGTIYMDDSDFAELDRDEFCDLVAIDPVPDTVNIYFVPDYVGLCGTGSFTRGDGDCQGVVMDNDCTATSSPVVNHSTFSHELGHYFNLLHTHETYFGAECVDGSNCSTDGDRLCDTEADPKLYDSEKGVYLVDDDCQYIGAAADACGSGVPYDPPTSNLMSYSSKSCRDHFSHEQLSVFASTAHTERENHLRYFDFDGDGEVGSYEIGLVVLNWNTTDSSSDVNRDGIVDVRDLLTVLVFWGDYL